MSELAFAGEVGYYYSVIVGCFIFKLPLNIEPLGGAYYGYCVGGAGGYSLFLNIPKKFIN